MSQTLILLVCVRCSLLATFAHICFFVCTCYARFYNHMHSLACLFVRSYISRLTHIRFKTRQLKQFQESHTCSLKRRRLWIPGGRVEPVILTENRESAHWEEIVWNRRGRYWAICWSPSACTNTAYCLLCSLACSAVHSFLLYCSLMEEISFFLKI